MKKVLLVGCLILVSLAGNAQEAANQSDLSVANTVLIASSITLGVTYLVTIVADAETAGRIDFPENFMTGHRSVHSFCPI